MAARFARQVHRFDGLIGVGGRQARGDVARDIGGDVADEFALHARIGPDGQRLMQTTRQHRGRGNQCDRPGQHSLASIGFAHGARLWRQRESGPAKVGEITVSRLSDAR